MFSERQQKLLNEAQEAERQKKKQMTKRNTNQYSSANSSISKSARRKTNADKDKRAKLMNINTRKDSMTDKSRATPMNLKSTNFYNSSISRNEKTLRINDENDDTLDMGRDTTYDFANMSFGHSKGFSLRNTPQTTIMPETEEVARLKRAYVKYSNNLQDWNKTSSKFNQIRQKGMKKQRSPIRSLV